MAKIARGEPAPLPVDYELVRIAHAWGVTVDEVRLWPADDVMHAIGLLPILGGRRGK